MKKMLPKRKYGKLKRFIVSNSSTIDCERCCVFLNNDIDVQMCFNDVDRSVRICKMDCYSSKIIDVFDYLLTQSKGKICKPRIDFYETHIEPNSECCL